MCRKVMLTRNSHITKQFLNSNANTLQKRFSSVKELFLKTNNAHGLPHISVRRKSSITSSLRLLVISDTHGFERQFGDTLPYADVLIHCGDFLMNSTDPGYLYHFLNEQSHIPTKIVLRGNCDKMRFEFDDPVKYVNIKRERVTLEDGTIIDLRPFFRSKDEPEILPDVDIFVSHEPPFGICDLNGAGKHCGSKRLRDSAEKSAVWPSVWVCGHVHRMRGAYDWDMGDGRRTVLVNASNANQGRARRIEFPPIIIDLSPN